MATQQPLVLVVDDEESIRESVTYTLEHESYRTITAATGSEALKNLRTTILT